jgi:hypothetical protein
LLPSLPDSHADAWVAIGTLALAAVTLILALISAAQVRTSRRALQASLRPLLVDVPLGGDQDAEVDITSDEKGLVEVEMRLRNAGTGLALIVGGPRLRWAAFPSGWTGVSQQLVVVAGEPVRLTFRRAFGNAQSAHDAVGAAQAFSAEVEYTDVNGKQWTRTTAYVISHPDEDSLVDMFVDRVELFDRSILHRVKNKPFVSLFGRHHD